MINSKMGAKLSPDKKSHTPTTGLQTSSSPERNIDDDNNSADGDQEDEDASPKKNPDIFSKFSLCHTAELKSNYPELSPELIEAKLREQWDSMTDEEANWYIYNGVPPGKLLPGKKRPRPKKFLDKLVEMYERQKNGIKA